MVRAFDRLRYRNFSTLTATRLVQFSCVAVDYSDEFVAAGTQFVCDIHLWSVKHEKLMEVLSSFRPLGITNTYFELPRDIERARDSQYDVRHCLRVLQAKRKGSRCFHPESKHHNVERKIVAARLSVKRTSASHFQTTTQSRQRKTLNLHISHQSCILAGGNSTHVCVSRKSC
jgi:hypothetical protein